jgi:hypothetical protein
VPAHKRALSLEKVQDSWLSGVALPSALLHPLAASSAAAATPAIFASVCFIKGLLSGMLLAVLLLLLLLLLAWSELSAVLILVTCLLVTFGQRACILPVMALIGWQPGCTRHALGGRRKKARYGCRSRRCLRRLEVCGREAQLHNRRGGGVGGGGLVHKRLERPDQRILQRRQRLLCLLSVLLRRCSWLLLHLRRGPQLITLPSSTLLLRRHCPLLPLLLLLHSCWLLRLLQRQQAGREGGAAGGEGLVAAGAVGPYRSRQCAGPPVGWAGMGGSLNAETVLRSPKASDVGRCALFTGCVPSGGRATNCHRESDVTVSTAQCLRRNFHYQALKARTCRPPQRCPPARAAAGPAPWPPSAAARAAESLACPPPAAQTRLHSTPAAQRLLAGR